MKYDVNKLPIKDHKNCYLFAREFKNCKEKFSNQQIPQILVSLNYFCLFEHFEND